MTERFLLDTNALSEPLRPAPSSSFLTHLRRRQREIATAAVVLHELLYGCRRLPPPRRRSAIERYIEDVVQATMPILPYDESAAAWHEDERVRLDSLGLTPSFVDGQIAAIAATRGLILVTANGVDFQHFDGLVLADWRS